MKKTAIFRIALILLSLTLLLSLNSVAARAKAFNPSCTDTSCIGLDPSTTNCANDAQTVASQEIWDAGGDYGELDLRFSLQCLAYWGKFTVFQGGSFLINATIGGALVAYARVTVWNPGQPSQGTTQSQSLGQALGSTTWSYMVGSDATACTGVEIILVSGQSSAVDAAASSMDDNAQPVIYNGEPTMYSEGWFWGPCYSFDTNTA